MIYIVIHKKLYCYNNWNNDFQNIAKIWNCLKQSINLKLSIEKLWNQVNWKIKMKLEKQIIWNEIQNIKDIVVQLDIYFEFNVIIT